MCGYCMYNWHMKIEADQKKAEANLKKHEITIRLISARRATKTERNYYA